MAEFKFLNPNIKIAGMKKILIIFYLCFFSLQLQAQTVLKLQQIRDSIYQHHPAFKMFDAASKSLQEEAGGAYSWSAPQLGAGFFMTPYNPEKWKVMNGQPGMGAFMISAEQMFPNKQKQQKTFAYLNERANVEQQKKQVSLNEYMFQAQSSYWSWVIAEKKLNVIQQQQLLLKQMLQQAEIQYANNISTLNGYYKTKSALENLKNTAWQLQSVIAQSKVMLNTLMNRSGSTDLLIDTTIQWTDFNDAMFVPEALQQKSELQVLDAAMKVNKLQYDAEMNQLKPEYGFRFDQMMGWAKQPWLFTAMLTVKLPFAKWAAKANKAKAQSLLTENQSLNLQKQVIINDAVGKANTLWLQLKLKKQQLQLYTDKIIPALQKNYETANTAFAQNTGNLFELFDAWQTLYDTNIMFLNEEEAALQLQAELLKVTEIKL